jgi:hypothetical protein
MSALKESKWSYVTGATGGVNFEFVLASGGTIVLRDPGSQDTSFHYAGAGVGLGIGLRLPRIKLPNLNIPPIKLPTVRGREVGGAGSAKSFESAGKIYMTGAFRGGELTRSDFQGSTVYIDAGVGLFYGKGGSAMLLGVNSAELSLGLSSPAMWWLAEYAIAQAPALLVMGGTVVGFQAGAGIGILLGYLH